MFELSADDLKDARKSLAGILYLHYWDVGHSQSKVFSKTSVKNSMGIEWEYNYKALNLVWEMFLIGGIIKVVDSMNGDYVISDIGRVYRMRLA